MKKGDWSSSDEEASDHEEGNSPQPVCHEEEKVDDSESESDEHEGGNSEESVHKSSNDALHDECKMHVSYQLVSVAILTTKCSPLIR